MSDALRDRRLLAAALSLMLGTITYGEDAMNKPDIRTAGAQTIQHDRDTGQVIVRSGRLELVVETKAASMRGRCGTGTAVVCSVLTVSTRRRPPQRPITRSTGIAA